MKIPKTLKTFLPRLLILSGAFAFAGCTAIWGEVNRGARSGESSSLVAWLYPRGEVPPTVEETPVLRVPLRVGLAFVPPRNGYANSYYLSEAHKSELLYKVRESFSEKAYIDSIQIIPQYYLDRARGISGMQQVARMMSVDVMALVSYDQVVHNFDTSESLLYWTIVGAYVVKGSKDEVHTFVDLAVVDVNTGKLLLRAPGMDKQSSKSTLVKNAESVRRSREQGFNLAMQEMSKNLDAELALFRERIKTDKSVRVETRSGFSGGGSASLLLALMLFLCRYTPRRLHRDSFAILLQRVRVPVRGGLQSRVQKIPASRQEKSDLRRNQ